MLEASSAQSGHSIKVRTNMIDYTGFNDIAYNPETLAWVSPAYLSDDYPCLAVWTVDGYRDKETGEVVGE